MKNILISMNNVIQAPTKVIKLRTDICSIYQNIVLKRDKGEEDTSPSVISNFLEKNKSLGSKIDFYRMKLDDEEELIDTESEDYQKSVAYENREIIDQNESFFLRKKLNNNSNLDFFLMGLKNDIRVRTFKYYNKMMYIYFWDVQDAISFYKQYFKIAEMTFASSYVFERDFCRGFNNDETDFQFNFYDKPASIEFLDNLDIREPFDCREKQNINNHFTVQHHLPVVKIPERDENIKQKIQHIKKEEPAEVHFTNCTASKKEQFINRIDYFNKMKNFFSKNDVKKMEALLKSENFGFIFLNSKEISCGSLSNVIMQEAMKIISEDEKCMVIKNLGHDICPIASTKYGAYTIQSIIVYSESAQAQKLLSYYFAKYGEFLFSHEIGNYAIQKVLRFDEELVFELCAKSLQEIIENPLGLKVFKRCLCFFSTKYETLIAMLQNIKNTENRDICEGLIAFINEQ